MKKALLAITLALVMVFTGCSGAVQSLSAIELPKKETPIADNADDNYKSYGNSGEDIDVSTEVLKKELEDMGAEFDVYESEEAYKRAQQKAEREAAENAKAIDTAFEPVMQTITVMTTATGSEEHGNYVPSKPIKNAVVRLDGIPRFTDRNGQIIAVLDKEYAELYVEKNDYVPYIEIMDVTGTEKIVYLKEPHDDIDVYAVMMDYEGEQFNLLAQPAYINKENTDSFCEITVNCNVPADSYYIIVNGEKRFYSATGLFENFKYTLFDESDNFAVQVIYEGISSKIYDLKLRVVMPYVSENIIKADDKNGSQKIELGNEDAPFGTVGQIDFDINDVLDRYIYSWLNARNTQFQVTDSLSLKFGYFFDVREGLVELSVGFEISATLLDKTLYHDSKRITELQEANKAKQQEIDNIEKEIAITQSEIDKLYKDLGDRAEVVKEKTDELNDLKRQYKQAKSDSALKEYLAELSRLKHNKSEQVSYHNKEYKKTLDSIKKITSMKNNAVAALKSVKGLVAKSSEIKDIFSSKESNFKLSFDLEVMGLFTYSVVSQKFVDIKVTGQVQLKFAYTYSFAIWLIPCFIKVEVGVGLKVEAIFINKDTGEVISPDRIKEFINILLTIKVRLDIGVGTCNGIIDLYVSGYGWFEFGIEFLPQEDNREIKFQWSAGIKIKLVFWEREWGYKSPEYDLNKKDEITETLKLMDRAALVENMSQKQIFDSVYPLSKAQFIDIEDGKYLTTWLEDSKKRDDYNRTVLMYSIYEDGKWSLPQDVFDTGKADLFPNLYSDGKNVYLTWQKCRKVFNETDTLETLLAAGDVFFARFNGETNKFEDVDVITNDSVMDAAPKFAVKEKEDDPLTIVWQRNSENDMLGIKGTNEIIFSQLKANVWTKPKRIFAENKIFSSVSAAIKDGNLTVSVVTDEDGDFMTTDGAVNIVTEAGVQKSNFVNVIKAEFSVLDNKSVLYYSDGKDLYCSPDLRSSELVLSDANLTDFNLSQDGKAIFYEKLNGDYRQGFCAVYDDISKSWTSDIVLTEEDNFVYSISGKVGLDGALHYIYNLQNQDGAAVFCYSKKEMDFNLSIENVFYLERIEDGKTMELNILVKNTGDKKIEELEFLCFDQKRNLALTQPLLIGEQRNFKVHFTQKIFKGKNNILEVRAISGEQAQAAAEFVLETVLADVNIIGETKIINGKQNFVITVSNDSDYDTSVVLYVYKNGKQQIEQKLYIAANAQITYTYIADAILKGDYLFFRVETDITNSSTVKDRVGIYSVQDEYINKVFTNEYCEVLEWAKMLL